MTHGFIENHASNSGYTYSYFIPSSIGQNEKLPVIIFLDPHGKGNFPLEKYRGFADKFHFIIMGSNDSKNGMGFDQSTGIANELKNESQTTLPGLPGQIFLAGFSGGAKAAIVAANTSDGFSGVIFCGAAFPPTNQPVKVPSIGFAGRKDMNYTEVRNFSAGTNNEATPSVLFEWNGKHEWPDSSVFADAFYWASFNRMRNGKAEKSQQLIDQYTNAQDKRLEKEKNILLKEMFLNEGIALLRGLGNSEKYISQLKAIKGKPEYAFSKNKENKILEAEDIQKKEIVDGFQTHDLAWWKNYTSKLSKAKENESDQRLLAYVSLAAWSFSSKSIDGNDPFFAQRALQIYKLADPENAEQPFLQACLFAKNGNGDSALVYLKVSVKMGNDDKNKIKNEKNLLSLHERSDFRELISQLK